MHGDAGGVNLNVGGVGHVSALAVALNGSRAVAAHGVGGEEVGVAITTGSNDDSVGREALQLTCDEVLGDDAAGTAIDDDDVFHLIAGEELHLAGLHLCAVGTEQQLLTGLALGIEGTADLSAAEGAVGQHAAVLTSKGNALCHALVDDIVGHLSQTIDVGLAGAVVATLHGVVEQTIDRVTVVLVVLGCVDTALGSDGVCAAGRVLNAEVIDVEAHLAQRGGGAGTGQTRAYDDDVELKFVLRVDQTLMSLVVCPLLGNGSLGYLAIYFLNLF